MNEIYLIEDYEGMGSGWKVNGLPGIYDSYTSAIAANIDMWEEYCEHHRAGRENVERTWRAEFETKRGGGNGRKGIKQ